MNDDVTARTPDTLCDDETSQADLRALVNCMQRDWATLNALLNATSSHYHWCSEWEGRIDMYNTKFEVLKLTGRADYGGRMHEVPDPFLLPGIPRLRAHFTTMSTPEPSPVPLQAFFRMADAIANGGRGGGG